MCMELLNDVVIQCEECGNIIVIKKEYLDAETSSYERQMGPEIVYDIYCMSAGKTEVKTTCAQLLSGGIRDIVDNPENCPIFNYLL